MFLPFYRNRDHGSLRGPAVNKDNLESRNGAVVFDSGQAPYLG